jgi:hypothetical protein
MAQDSTTASRVRITLAQDPLKDGARQSRGAERMFVGRLMMQNADSVVVLQDGFGLRTIRTAEIRSMDASNGTRRHVVRGLVIGGLAGVVAGGVAGFVSGSAAHDAAMDCRPVELAGAIFCGIGQAVTDPGLYAMAGAMVFGVVGTVGGGVVGLLTKTEKWSPMQLSPGAPQSGLIVRAGKTNRIGLSFAF